MPDIGTTTLLIATFTLGLMSGLFYAYAGSVLGGLRGADDRTAVEVMQRFNVSIVSAPFLVLFLGALAATGLAAYLHRGAGERAVLVPTSLALVLYALTLGITFAVNIPLNNRLAAAGPGDEPGTVRAAFFPRWARWNLVRTVTCTGAFAAACWALVQRGGL